MTFNRPQHPDFEVLSQIIREEDATADAAGQTHVASSIAALIDEDTLMYTIDQRILRLETMVVGKAFPDPIRSMMAALWLEAFVYGNRYGQVKGRRMGEEEG